MSVEPVEEIDPVVEKLIRHLENEHFESFQSLHSATFLERWHNWLHAHPEKDAGLVHLH